MRPVDRIGEIEMIRGISLTILLTTLIILVLEVIYSEIGAGVAGAVAIPLGAFAYIFVLLPLLIHYSAE